MKLRLAVIMVMSQFAALTQQPLGEVTYFLGFPLPKISRSRSHSMCRPMPKR